MLGKKQQDNATTTTAIVMCVYISGKSVPAECLWNTYKSTLFWWK